MPKDSWSSLMGGGEDDSMGMGMGMDSDMSSLGFGSSSGSNRPGPAVMTFLMRPSPSDHSLTVVHSAGQAADAPPVFSSLTRALEPNITMYQASPSNIGILGTANFNSSHSSTELVLRGKPLALKKSTLGDHYSIEGPMGKFSWTRDQLGTSSALELVDASKQKIAKLSKNKAAGLLTKEQSLEFYVRPDDYLIEMIMLTALVVNVLHKETKKEENKAAVKVIGHLISGGIVS